MGNILDILQGNPGAASPWSALYQTPPGTTAPSPDIAAIYGALGIDPSALSGQNLPPPSPFGDPSKLSVANPSSPPPAPAPLFGGGAAPFSFAGPGSMSVQPSQIAPQAAPAPQPVPATAAPVAASAPPQSDQAGPIAVGNYQMPRVGAADDFEPDDSTPANATPTQGRSAPAPQTAPFSLGGAASGVGDRLGLAGKGFLGNMASGPIGALAGGLGALISGKPTDAASIAQQGGNLTAQALIAKGASPAEVSAAARNPELMKALIGQYYGKEKYSSVNVKNADGSETPRAFNTQTGEYTGGAPAAPQGRFAVDENLTGQARLDALRKADPDYARRIESMVNGDIPLPTGVAALKPNADRMIKDVLAVDGSTSASDFATRAATRKDYASGVASRVTKSLNTTIEHAATLDSAIDKLKNYSYFPGISNYVHDKYSSNTDKQYQTAKAQFETAKEAFVKELDFTLSGGHSSVSGSAELRDKISRADSPEALHAAVQTALHLLSARLDSHTKGFSEGTKSQRDPQDFLYPKNRAVYNRLLGSADTSTGQSVPGVSAGGAPAGDSAPTPVAAGNYVWTPGGGLVGTK